MWRGRARLPRSINCGAASRPSRHSADGSSPLICRRVWPRVASNLILARCSPARRCRYSKSPLTSSAVRAPSACPSHASCRLGNCSNCCLRSRSISPRRRRLPVALGCSTPPLSSHHIGCPGTSRRALNAPRDTRQNCAAARSSTSTCTSATATCSSAQLSRPAACGKRSRSSILALPSALRRNISLTSCASICATCQRPCIAAQRPTPT